jgi:hypothetical protein
MGRLLQRQSACSALRPVGMFVNVNEWNFRSSGSDGLGCRDGLGRAEGKERGAQWQSLWCK